MGSKVRLFTDSDLATLNTWLGSRRLSTVTREYLPTIGFVIDGEAMCFLYKTDSAIAYVENLISNPTLSPKERDAALNAVITACTEQAKHDGYKLLLSTTTKPSVISRTSALGWTSTTGHALLALLTNK